MYGIMTNNHVLDSNSIQPGKSFIIILNKMKYRITVNENDFMFTSELIDVTFIQLTDDFFIKNPKFEFFEPCFDSNSNNNNNNNNDDDNDDNDDDDDNDGDDDDDEQDIYIFQYPKGILSFDYGLIKHISGFNYFHNLSTNCGSSGSPLLNDDLKVLGIHKSGYSDISNVATNINSINYAITILYNKSYINEIKKAREPTRKLNEEELEELKIYGLKMIKEKKLSVRELLNLKNLELEEGVEISNEELLRLENIGSEELNMYTCSYYENPTLKLLFYRTNHAWYFTSMKVKDITYDIITIKTYNWILINPHESIKEIISRSNKKLEHQHQLIIMWLKLSELKYM